MLNIKNTFLNGELKWFNIFLSPDRPDLFEVNFKHVNLKKKNQIKIFLNGGFGKKVTSSSFSVFNYFMSLAKNKICDFYEVIAGKENLVNSISKSREGQWRRLGLIMDM